MESEDGLVNFAGGVSLFVAEDGADDDVSIVKPQVGALVSLYFDARFASVYPWPLCGKEGVSWGRHGVSIKLALWVLYDDTRLKVVPVSGFARATLCSTITSTPRHTNHVVHQFLISERKVNSWKEHPFTARYKTVRCLVR
jgi:hypothetical protein